MEHWSVNEAAAAIVENEVIPLADRLNIEIHRLNNGATVIDMGIKAKGGFRAGKYFAEIGMGGLGKLRYMMMKSKDLLLPGLQCTTENPDICELSSYCAATLVKWKESSQVVSGPIRAIRRSDHFSEKVPYTDPHPQKAVCGVQTTEMPDEELTDNIAGVCGISADRIYIMAARTGCMTGAVQVCARNVEQSLPTVADRGFDMSQILEGNATTPLICVVDDEDIALGRVNDCLIYGQETNLTVSCEDGAIENMLEDIPFSKNTAVYGIPFQKLFESCDRNWKNCPREWDAPCRINFFNVNTGRMFCTGRVNKEILKEGFLGAGGYVR